MLLNIELLSDLCTYSGDTYNSLVDIDVVYDDYGLPYIPAKRLKGCIREAYLELVEFGVMSKECYEKIFGKEGNQASGFMISNAYLQGYRTICDDLDNAADSKLTHPQNVLDLYTYMRTQTAMDYETGSAEKNSLRTMRVVNKGLVFESEIHFDDKMTKVEIESLLQAAQMVKHMGYGRTRGLGLIKVTEKEGGNSEGISVAHQQIHEKNLMHYRIFLKAPILCKSAEGNQARSQNFIEGSKVLGMLAGAMGNQAFQKLMSVQSVERGNELIVSNAYIEHGGRRCLPISASLQKVKDLTFDEKGQMEVYDMLTASGVTEQLTPTGFTYAANDGTVKGVDMEIHYHHRRPEDKSVGRADGKGGSAFYQLESIRQGQAFRGYILADREQAEEIIKAFNRIKNPRIGYGKNAEYGTVQMKIDDIEPVGYGLDKKVTTDFVIRLDAPVILYNETGMLTSDVAVFCEYLSEILETDDLELKNCFIKYETIGGYNVTWGRRKPVFTTLGKGTVCLYHSDTGADVSKLTHCFVGERVNEGFGEISVLEIPAEKCVLKKAEKDVSKEGMTDCSGILAKLRHMQAIKTLDELARKDACARRGFYAKEESNAVIGRMILVFKEQPTYEAMEEQIKQWESDSKKKIAGAAMKDIRSVMNQRGQGIAEQEAYREVAEAYLEQVKYQFRVDKNAGGNEHGSK